MCTAIYEINVFKIVSFGEIFEIAIGKINQQFYGRKFPCIGEHKIFMFLPPFSVEANP